MKAFLSHCFSCGFMGLTCWAAALSLRRQIPTRAGSPRIPEEAPEIETKILWEVNLELFHGDWVVHILPLFSPSLFVCSFPLCSALCSLSFPPPSSLEQGTVWGLWDSERDQGQFSGADGWVGEISVGGRKSFQQDVESAIMDVHTDISPMGKWLAAGGALGYTGRILHIGALQECTVIV